jgi:hypothetical protein
MRTAATTVYLLKRDLSLVERRMGVAPIEKIIQAIDSPLWSLSDCE